VLRGLAVAGMILVISPGDWDSAYSQLRHAAWHGWTLADMVFPTFLFSVGVGLGLSFPRPWDADTRRAFRRRVIRRALLLIGLGLALEATGLLVGYYAQGSAAPGLETLRLPGILQRIALCYALAAALLVASGARTPDARLELRPAAIAGFIVAILLFYWALLSLVPVPGFGAGRLDPEGNLSAYLDRAIFTPAHLWPYGVATPGGLAVYDPEGLLSTLPAAVNVLFGVLAAVAWRKREQRAWWIIGFAGLIGLAAGMALDPVFVVNKRIWTSSFAVLSGGASAMLLAVLILAWRSGFVSAILTPARILGGNAIAAFVLSTLLGRLYDLPMLHSEEARITPRQWLWETMQSVVNDPQFAAFLCAAMFLALVALLLWPLHTRNVHLRL